MADSKTVKRKVFSALNSRGVVPSIVNIEGGKDLIVIARSENIVLCCSKDTLENGIGQGVIVDLDTSFFYSDIQVRPKGISKDSYTTRELLDMARCLCDWYVLGNNIIEEL